MTKKVLLLIVILSINLFGYGGGFEISLNVPIGASIGTPNNAMKNLGYTSKKGIDSGLEIQLGYMHKIYSRIGAGLFIDLGYTYDSFPSSKTFENGEIIDTSMYMHNFEIGFMPKITIWGVSLAIGGGIKIPMAGKKDLEYGYSASVMHYFKTTLDYSIFITDNLAIVLGVYISHDYGLPLRSLTDTPRIGGSGGGALIGFKFGPKLEDKN
ncbi:hypothetical protein [Brachyspira murdochii]|uniref:Serpentine_recp domain containing protein n=1 Tax=Brachyspira murdochii TaxID=84378 RepID=A0ABX5B2S2_9SPIR|nr:hypothetical protein [Brachyspira murdochii]PPS21599.1 hypothetical protein DJ52_09730 [Brachyspira murdochii]